MCNAGDVPESPKSISLREALGTWTRVAMLSFGGPAGQIAVMHRILVDEKKWIREDRFVHALNYCMLLPGPEAQQLATYIGWLMHRTWGGLMAGTLFVLPGIVSILLLSIAYVEYQQTVLVKAILFGLKPAVMAIVVQAVIRIAKRVLKSRTMVAVATCSFVAIFFFAIPFPLLIVVAATVGFLGSRFGIPGFLVLQGHAPTIKHSAGNDVEQDIAEPFLTHAPAPTLRRALLVSAICLTLWWTPLLVVGLIFGRESVFFQEGLFFSKAAVVTFGGAYSVLAYIAQQAVGHYHWMQPGEMLDGLGMAETTPGPLIMVVQFVGFLGAYRSPGNLPPLVAGLLGSLLTTWVTFAPCFYWIFLGAPYVERLRANRVWASALSTITAAVVGVILNLAIWFSLHTVFEEVCDHVIGPMKFQIPNLATLDAAALMIAIAAFFLTFYWKCSMLLTLAICCGLGLAKTLLAN